VLELRLYSDSHLAEPGTGRVTHNKSTFTEYNRQTDRQTGYSHGACSLHSSTAAPVS